VDIYLAFKKGGGIISLQTAEPFDSSWKRAREGGGSSCKFWETQTLDSGSLQVTRGSRNQGVIGGVIFYTIILNIRGDVICSVMTEWDYFRTKCSGP
jgi:hypothetical protein